MARRQPLHGISNVDAHRDPTSLIRRLEQARDTAFARSIDERIIALLEAQPGGRYLDVGCGAGDDTRDLARLVGPEGTVVGVDIGSAMLARARERSAGADLAIAFLAADAHHLGFRDDAFDGCRAERLLEHLEDPRQALREMARVTRPGGRIAICEPDWGTAVIHGGNQEVSRLVLDAWGRSLRQGFVGRALPGLFKQAGLVDLTIDPWTEFSRLEGYPSARGQREWDVSAGARKAEAMGTVSAETASTWLDQLDEAVRRGSFFMSLTCFLVSGRKP